MKKLIACLALVFFTAACTPAAPAPDTAQSGMTCEKCPCCQKMEKGAAKATKMQCPMMKDGATGQMQCGCCQKMAEDTKCGCCEKMMETSQDKNAQMQCPMMKEGAKQSAASKKTVKTSGGMK